MGTISRIYHSIRSGRWWGRGRGRGDQEGGEESEGRLGGLFGKKEDEDEDEEGAGKGKGKAILGSALRPLQFGVEIELYLRPKPETTRTVEAVRAEFREAGRRAGEWDLFAETLRRLLRRVDIVARAKPTRQDKYKHWGITGDGSLGRLKGFHTVELVSPKLQHPLGQTLNQQLGTLKDIATVWKCLEENFDIESSEKCGTHVHFSPLDWYKLDDLQALATAIIFFDPLIDGLIPERQFNQHCRSNTWFSQLCPFSDGDEGWSYSYQTSFRRIESCREKVQLADHMSPEINNRRHMAWNFMGIFNRDRDSVEFRRPPGSHSWEDTMSWVEFVHGFATASWDPTIWQVPKSLGSRPEQLPKFQDLREFVLKGAKKAGLRTNRLESLFEGKSLDPSWPSAYREYKKRVLGTTAPEPSQQEEEMQAKKRQEEEAECQRDMNDFLRIGSEGGDGEVSPGSGSS
ncbi:hypothetical protein TWF281_002449 [Arthrobotrys megalospora]